VDGTQKGDDYELDWTEEIDLGAFYNAGAYPATIVFSTELIVELEPGEVVFTSSTHTLSNLKGDMVAESWTCQCRCKCIGCPLAPVITYSCGDPPSACTASGTCNYHSCSGTVGDCVQHWTYSCSP